MLYFFEKERWNYEVAVFDTDDFTIDTYVPMEKVLKLHQAMPNLFPQLFGVMDKDIQEGIEDCFSSQSYCRHLAAESFSKLGKFDFIVEDRKYFEVKITLPRSKILFNELQEVLKIRHGMSMIVIKLDEDGYLTVNNECMQVMRRTVRPAYFGYEDDYLLIWTEAGDAIEVYKNGEVLIRGV